VVPVGTRRRDIVFYTPRAGTILTPDAHPSGGAEVQVLHLARGLAHRGARVALVTYAAPGLPSAVDGIEVIAQPYPAHWPAPLRRAATLATTCVRLLRLDARVVVQRAAGSTTGLVALAAKATRTRFVYSSASTVDFTFERLGYGRTTAALFGLGIRLADEIVVQTDEQAELCVRRFGRHPVVIRSVAERPAGAPAPDGSASDGFLWVGRLARYKNPAALLDLAAAVPEVPFTMVCVPAADDPPGLAEELGRHAEALPNVRLVGPQRRAALLELMARATAIVSTSDYEGMPNTLLEGWSRGVPALTLAHDPDGVIGREQLGWCAGGEPARLAEQARLLWAGRADDAGLRTRCREYVHRRHDPAVVIGQWAQTLGLDPGARPR
jgi:glycosyltransferase involved in cell wall biosynthesis